MIRRTCKSIVLHGVYGVRTRAYLVPKMVETASNSITLRKPSGRAEVRPSGDQR